MNISATTTAKTDLQEMAPAEIKPGVVRPLNTKEVQAATEAEKKTGESGNKEEPNASRFTREDAQEMVEVLNEMTQTLQTKLNFSLNEGTNDIVVRVVDKDTNEVIKQFPPEKILELREKMQDLTGFLFNADA